MLFRCRIVKVAFAVLLVGVPCMSQTRDELQRKYSSEDAKHYIVRSGIVLTATFTEEGQACDMMIEPQPPPGSNKVRAKVMSSREVTEIINEIAPVGRRGRFIREIAFTGGCNSIRTTEYEEVTISRTKVCASEGGRGEITAAIHWKRSNCSQQVAGKVLN